jgi:hypothetical protein
MNASSRKRNCLLAVQLSSAGQDGGPWVLLRGRAVTVVATATALIGCTTHAPPGPTCDEQSERALSLIHNAIAAAGSSCETNADCEWVETTSTCALGCAALIARAGGAAVTAAVTQANTTICADSCPQELISTPGGCGVPVGLGGECVSGFCVVYDNAYCGLDGGVYTCVDYNQTWPVCPASAVESLPCDSTSSGCMRCDDGAATTCACREAGVEDAALWGCGATMFVCPR